VENSDISDFQAIDYSIIVHGYIEYSLFCITLLLQSWCIPLSQSKSAQIAMGQSMQIKLEITTKIKLGLHYISSSKEVSINNKKGAPDGYIHIATERFTVLKLFY